MIQRTGGSGSADDSKGADLGPPTEDAREVSRRSGGRFVIRSISSVRIVLADEVISATAANHYVRLQLVDGSCLYRGSMNEVAEILGSSCVRIHRSHIVRVDLIRQIRRRKSGHREVVLRDGRELPVGRTYFENVRDVLALGGETRLGEEPDPRYP